MLDTIEGSIEQVAASIFAREQGLDPDAAPAESAAPEVPEIQSPEAQDAALADEGVITSEEAQAPAAEVPASQAAEVPKPNPEAPKAEQRVAPEPSPAIDAEANTNQLLQRINSIVQQLEANGQNQFSDLKTPQDVLRLMKTEPERYNDFVAFQTEIQMARSAKQQAHGEAHTAFIAKEQARLMKEIPDLADHQKGEALRVKLRAYAKSQGIPDTRQARNADEVIRLHREMTLSDELNTLKSEKAAQAASLVKAQEKAAVAPKVQAPGAPRQGGPSNKLKELEDRFNRTGKPEDLALLFAARDAA